MESIFSIQKQYVTIHELFEIADKAIYEAKQTRSTIVIEPLAQ